MDIFEVKNGRAIPTEHALLIEPFKSMWEKDTTKDKGTTIKNFTFIELMCSRKKSNPFIGYSLEDRYGKVAKNIFGDEKLDPSKSDPQIVEAMSVYNEFLLEASPSLSYLRAAFAAADKLKYMLETVDFSERTNGGSAVYKPSDITNALKQTPDVVRTLENLKEKVENELLEEAKTRGAREIGLFER